MIFASYTQVPGAMQKQDARSDAGLEARFKHVHGKTVSVIHKARA